MANNRTPVNWSEAARRQLQANKSERALAQPPESNSSSPCRVIERLCLDFTGAVTAAKARTILWCQTHDTEENAGHAFHHNRLDTLD